MKSFQASGISVSFGDRTILKDASFTMTETSRIALVGRNGSGKTTLMKAAVGLIDKESGTVTHSKSVRVEYLAQSDILIGSKTLFDSAEEGYSYLDPLLEELRECEENPNDEKALIRSSEIREALDDLSYFDRSWRIESILLGLGFDKSDFNRRADEFSSGYQMRIALSRLLISNCDFMLLDEPTNYLDIDSLTWLEEYLKSYKGGLMIVSHDQDFLDRTVNEVLEIENSTLIHYKGNYSSYTEQKKQKEIEEEKKREREEKEIKRTEDFIERFRYKATKAKQVQSRIKALEKMDITEKKEKESTALFRFPPSPPSGELVIRLKDLKKNYGDRVIFSSFSLDVVKKERVAVTGKNGIGKSTLLRILAKRDDDFKGELKWGSNIELAYFDNDDDTYRNNSNTVIDELRSVSYISDEPRLRNMLGSFLFKGDDILKKVNILSGGERSRLSLLKILLHPSNLLILDEPTNHLDIPTKEILINAIKSYTGTVIFSSHDKHFIKEIAEKIVYIDEDGPTLYLGDYDYFEYKLEEKEKKNLVENSENKKRAEDKNSEEKHRSERNKRRSLERALSAKENEITESESKIKELENMLSDPTNYSSKEKGERINRELLTERERLSRLEGEWEEIIGELDNG